MFSNKLGAAPKAFAYDSKIDSGFMANVGKLIPINEPDERNFLTTNLTTLVWFFFLSSLMKKNPPFFLSAYQS